MKEKVLNFKLGRVILTIETKFWTPERIAAAKWLENNPDKYELVEKEGIWKVEVTDPPAEHQKAFEAGYENGFVSCIEFYSKKKKAYFKMTEGEVDVLHQEIGSATWSECIHLSKDKVMAKFADYFN